MSKDKIETIKQWLGTGSINIFGRQFSGKDTQGRLLADLFGGVLLSGGEIIRNSNLPDDVMKIINSGELMPTEQYVDFVAPFLSNPDFANQPLILSTVGRWIGEEQGVIEVTNKANHPIKAVVNLEISEDVTIERWNSLHSEDLRGQRDDDTYEALKKRLLLFNQKTLPVIDVYSSMGLVVNINAELPVDDVTRIILDRLHELATT